MQAARGATVTGRTGATTPVALLPRPRATATVLGVLALGVALDQATKAWVVTALAPGERRPFVGNLLQLHLVRNSGAAFSLGSGTTWVFSLLAIAALGVLLGWVVPRVRRTVWAVASGLFGAGIAGNLADRLLRPPGALRGHVVDFLELPNWPIFNVADMCIVSAAVLLVWLSFFGKVGHDGRPREARDDEAMATDPADAPAEEGAGEHG